MPKKGVDSPASLEADAAHHEQHHHSGRIVPKKGVEGGDEDDGGIRNGFILWHTERACACHLQNDYVLFPCFVISWVAVACDHCVKTFMNRTRQISNPSK